MHGEEDWIPAQLVKRGKVLHAYYSFGGEEHSANYFDVLTDPQNKLRWVPAYNGEHPSCADEDFLDNGKLRIGRFNAEANKITIGKISKADTCMFFTWYGVEYKTYNYEALCTDN